MILTFYADKYQTQFYLKTAAKIFEQFPASA